jgi:hypothetical protein
MLESPLIPGIQSHQVLSCPTRARGNSPECSKSSRCWLGIKGSNQGKSELFAKQDQFETIHLYNQMWRVKPVLKVISVYVGDDPVGTCVFLPDIFIVKWELSMGDGHGVL